MLWKSYEKVMKILWAQLAWLKKNLRKNYEKLVQKSGNPKFLT